MTIQTLETVLASPGGSNSYETGYLDGRLAAVDKTPASIVLSRAAAADLYDPLWAQGYDDGYIDQTALHAALREQEANQ